MRRVWALILLLATLALGAWLYLSARPVPLSDADAQTLRVAKQLYDTDQAAEAAAILQQLVDSGQSSAELYYNLGTAYQTLDDQGRAVYYLRLAEALAPRDADIQTNLSLARAAVGARQTRGDALQQALRQVESSVSLNETALLALGLWLLFAALVVIVGILRRGVFRALFRFLMLVVGILTFAAALAFGVRIYYELTEPPAVVMQPNVHPSAAPGGEANTRISLPPGSEVRIVQLEGGWARITLPGTAAQGWVPAPAVRTLAS